MDLIFCGVRVVRLAETGLALDLLRVYLPAVAQCDLIHFAMELHLQAQKLAAPRRVRIVGTQRIGVIAHLVDVRLVENYNDLELLRANEILTDKL